MPELPTEDQQVHLKDTPRLGLKITFPKDAGYTEEVRDEIWKAVEAVQQRYHLGRFEFNPYEGMFTKK